MAFGIGFDALTDFISKAYTAASETDAPAAPGPIAPVATPEEQRETDELQQRLRQSEAQARAANDVPLSRFLRQLEQAWTARRSGEPIDPKLLQQLKEQRQELASGDTFGAPRSVPPEVLRVLSALELSATLGPQPAETPAGDYGDYGGYDIEAELAAAEAEFSAENPGEPLESQGSVDDAKVKQFLRTYFGESFEAREPPLPEGTFDEEQILAELPESQQHKLLQLPPAERKFVLTASTAHQIVHAQLPPAEAKFFATLTGEQRGQYLAMNPDEKAFVRQLDPDERAHYLALNADNRALLRAQSPAQRKAQAAEWKARLEKDADRPPEEVSLEVADGILAELGADPVRDAGLREKARALAYNFLTQKQGDRAAAEAGTLKAMLADPQVLEPLLDDLEESFLEQEPISGEERAKVTDADKETTEPASKKARRPRAEYTQHFSRIRSTLPQLAQQFVQPGLTRDALLGGMKKAVELSAEFVAAYPRGAARRRVSAMMRGVPIAG